MHCYYVYGIGIFSCVGIVAEGVGLRRKSPHFCSGTFGPIEGLVSVREASQSRRELLVMSSVSCRDSWVIWDLDLDGTA
jgi:hypothetical protein